MGRIGRAAAASARLVPPPHHPAPLSLHGAKVGAIFIAGKSRRSAHSRRQPRSCSPHAVVAVTSPSQAWEGGLRGVSFAHGPGIVPGKRINDLAHAIDWLPTIISFVGGVRQNPKKHFDIGVDHVSQRGEF